MSKIRTGGTGETLGYFHSVYENRTGGVGESRGYSYLMSKKRILL